VTDANSDLVARLARRGEEVRDDSPSRLLIPTTGEWNSPIDMVQADSLTAREVIRGEFAEARERVACWVPRPWPGRRG
jgi:hypothetical protein